MLAKSIFGLPGPKLGIPAYIIHLPPYQCKFGSKSKCHGRVARLDCFARLALSRLSMLYCTLFLKAILMHLLGSHLISARRLSCQQHRKDLFIPNNLHTPQGASWPRLALTPQACQILTRLLSIPVVNELMMVPVLTITFLQTYSHPWY